MSIAANALQLLTRDVAVKATTKCGRFRIVAVSTREILHETMRRHSLLPSSPIQLPEGANSVFQDTPAEIAMPQLGNMICAANLWAALLNNEERVRVEFQSQYATPTAESLALGETRAFLLPPTSVEGAATGGLRVSRALYGQTQPFLSATVAPGGSPNDLSLAHQVQYHCAQSDGVPAAVLFATSFDPATGIPAYNAGVMVQPIAASENRTTDAVETIGALQRAFRGVMVDDDEEARAAELDPAALQATRVLLSRRLYGGLAIHDLLGLATGDWVGVARACDGARQLGGFNTKRMLEAQLAAATRKLDDATFMEGREATVRLTEDIRRSLDEMASTERYPASVLLKAPTGALEGSTGLWLGHDPRSHGIDSLAIDETTVVRTPLDFYCRCNKAGFMTALRAVGLEGVKARRRSNPDMDFKCMHCMRVWRLSPADWDSVEAAFPTPSA